MLVHDSITEVLFMASIDMNSAIFEPHFDLDVEFCDNGSVEIEPLDV